MANPKRQMKRMLLGATLLSLAATMITAWTPGPGGNSSAARPGVASHAPAENSKADLVRVFVHEFDLYPDLIERAPGKLLLRAENEKGTDIALVVQRVDSGASPQRVARLQVAQNTKRAVQELTLGVGEYVFYEESTPALRGKIVVK